MTRFTIVRVAAACAVTALAACGSAGPSKQYIQAAIQRAVEAQFSLLNGSIRAMGGVPPQMTTIPKVEVTEATCLPHENGIFHCTVTATAAGSTTIKDADFKKVDGVWTLIQ